MGAPVGAPARLGVMQWDLVTLLDLSASTRATFNWWSLKWSWETAKESVLGALSFVVLRLWARLQILSERSVHRELVLV